MGTAELRPHLSADKEEKAEKKRSRHKQYVSYCNMCFEKQSWCGLPHIDIARQPPLSSFELKVRRRARLRSGKSHAWLDSSEERNRLKAWNMRRVIYKPAAAIKMQQLVRRFLVRNFLRRVSLYIRRKDTCPKKIKIILIAASDARYRMPFFVTQMCKTVRGFLGRIRVKHVRACQIQKCFRGFLGRKRVRYLRWSVYRLSGKAITSVHLHVKGCNGVANADSGGSSDPFCTVKQFGAKVRSTKTIENTLNPVWDEENIPISFTPGSLVPLNGIGTWFLCHDIHTTSVQLCGLLEQLQTEKGRTALSTCKVYHQSVSIEKAMPILDWNNFP